MPVDARGRGGCRGDGVMMGARESWESPRNGNAPTRD